MLNFIVRKYDIYAHKKRIKLIFSQGAHCIQKPNTNTN